MEIPTINTAVINSPIGRIFLESKGEMLSKIQFVEDDIAFVQPTGILHKTSIQLSEYFEGSRTTFDIALLPVGTHFQKKVWNELQKIPFGKTCSYQEIACRLGDIKVIRAAATANGRNPLPIIIPCHRVIGKDGSLVGYSGGVWRKRFLLELEQRKFQPNLL